MPKRSSVSDVLKSVLPRTMPAAARGGRHGVAEMVGVLALLSAGGSLALAQAPGDAGRTPGGPQDPVYAVGGLTRRAGAIRWPGIPGVQMRSERPVRWIHLVSKGAAGQGAARRFYRQLFDPARA